MRRIFTVLGVMGLIGSLFTQFSVRQFEATSSLAFCDQGIPSETPEWNSWYPFSNCSGNCMRSPQRRNYTIPACCWCNQPSPRAYPPTIVASRKSKRRVILRYRRLIGDASRVRWKRAGLTQEKLAEIVGLNPEYIGEVERGEKTISIEALLRIAGALKTPVREFFRNV